jgi:hypothetical protein
MINGIRARARATIEHWLDSFAKTHQNQSVFRVFGALSSGFFPEFHGTLMVEEMEMGESSPANCFDLIFGRSLDARWPMTSLQQQQLIIGLLLC